MPLFYGIQAIAFDDPGPRFAGKEILHVAETDEEIRALLSKSFAPFSNELYEKNCLADKFAEITKLNTPLGDVVTRIRVFEDRYIAYGHLWNTRYKYLGLHVYMKSPQGEVRPALNEVTLCKSQLEWKP